MFYEKRQKNVNSTGEEYSIHSDCIPAIQSFTKPFDVKKKQIRNTHNTVIDSNTKFKIS